MPARRIVTFLSDFGTADTFVGQMKGAALAVCPDLAVVDLSHEVPPHDVAAGAYLLWTAFRAFPPGTIHVAVVDPGVGTDRRAVVVRTENHYFLAPDNGILTRVLDEEPAGSAYLLEAPHYRRPSPSPTFDGRDLFAPAAGWIAKGNEASHFGAEAGDLVRLEIPKTALAAGKAVPVRVIWVDRFGNVTLDLPRSAFAPLLKADAPAPRVSVETPGGPVLDLVRTYAQGAPGRPFMVFNSADHLELALREGRAADKLGLRPGMEVRVTVG